MSTVKEKKKSGFLSLFRKKSKPTSAVSNEDLTSKSPKAELRRERKFKEEAKHKQRRSLDSSTLKALDEAVDDVKDEEKKTSKLEELEKPRSGSSFSLSKKTFAAPPPPAQEQQRGRNDSVKKSAVSSLTMDSRKSSVASSQLETQVLHYSVEKKGYPAGKNSDSRTAAMGEGIPLSPEPTTDVPHVERLSNIILSDQTSVRRMRVSAFDGTIKNSASNKSAAPAPPVDSKTPTTQGDNRAIFIDLDSILPDPALSKRSNEADTSQLSQNVRNVEEPSEKEKTRLLYSSETKIATSVTQPPRSLEIPSSNGRDTKNSPSPLPPTPLGTPRLDKLDAKLSLKRQKQEEDIQERHKDLRMKYELWEQIQEQGNSPEDARKLHIELIREHEILMQRLHAVYPEIRERPSFSSLTLRTHPRRAPLDTDIFKPRLPLTTQVRGPLSLTTSSATSSSTQSSPRSESREGVSSSSSISPSSPRMYNKRERTQGMDMNSNEIKRSQTREVSRTQKVPIASQTREVPKPREIPAAPRTAEVVGVVRPREIREDPKPREVPAVASPNVVATVSPLRDIPETTKTTLASTTYTSSRPKGTNRNTETERQNAIDRIKEEAIELKRKELELKQTNRKEVKNERVDGKSTETKVTKVSVGRRSEEKTANGKILMEAHDGYIVSQSQTRAPHRTNNGDYNAPRGEPTKVPIRSRPSQQAPPPPTAMVSKKIPTEETSYRSPQLTPKFNHYSPTSLNSSKSTTTVVVNGLEPKPPKPQSPTVSSGTTIYRSSTNQEISSKKRSMEPVSSTSSPSVTRKQLPASHVVPRISHAPNISMHTRQTSADVIRPIRSPPQKQNSVDPNVTAKSMHGRQISLDSPRNSNAKPYTSDDRTMSPAATRKPILNNTEQERKRNVDKELLPTLKRVATPVERSGVQLGKVLDTAPSTSRETPVTTPTSNTTAPPHFNAPTSAPPAPPHYVPPAPPLPVFSKTNGVPVAPPPPPPLARLTAENVPSPKKSPSSSPAKPPPLSSLISSDQLADQKQKLKPSIPNKSSATGELDMRDTLMAEIRNAAGGKGLKKIQSSIKAGS